MEQYRSKSKKIHATDIPYHNDGVATESDLSFVKTYCSSIDMGNAICDNDVTSIISLLHENQSDRLEIIKYIIIFTIYCRQMVIHKSETWHVGSRFIRIFLINLCG